MSIYPITSGKNPDSSSSISPSKQARDSQPKPSLFQRLTKRIFSAKPAIATATPVVPNFVPLTTDEVASGLIRFCSKWRIPMDELLYTIDQVCKDNSTTVVDSYAGLIFISHKEGVGVRIRCGNNYLSISPEFVRNLRAILQPPPMFNHRSSVPPVLEGETIGFLSVRDQATSAPTSKGFQLSPYRKKASVSFHRVDDQIGLAQKLSGDKFSKKELALRGVEMSGFPCKNLSGYSVNVRNESSKWSLSYEADSEGGATIVALTYDNQPTSRTVIPRADFLSWAKIVAGRA